MRRRARTDANHADIREALRAVGWEVFDISAVGRGWPDLLAVKHGVVRFIEVKDGEKPPSARQLTKDEAEWHARYQRAGGQVLVVTSVDEALALGESSL